MSNLPLSVIYDPDQNTFTPNWGTSTLQITPAIYYAGSALTLGTTGLTVTWKRQEGVAGEANLTTGESVVNNGVLQVTANKFTSSSTMLTYIVTATYAEPTSGQTLTAKGQITFTLVKNASTAKTCTITGGTIFKYNTSQTLVGASSITLTGKVNNVSISAWQYKNGSGTWVTYPNSGSSDSLTVNASDAVFTDDVCVIRLTTSDNSVYDLHTITKLRDGAAGTSTVSAVLTNDDQMIPYNKQGVGDFSSATSQIIIYEGGTNVTETWTITQTPTNVTSTPSNSGGTHGSNNDTVTVSALAASTGNVTFTCTKSGMNTLTKTFSLVKVESGADGVTPTIYSVEADTYVLNKDINNTYTPASVTFSAYQQSSGNKTAYNGRFQIFENISLPEYDAATVKPTANYTSTSNENSHAYTPSTSATSILCILYQSGGTSTRLDSQQVVVSSDGATGATGPDGAAGVTIILGNYADVLTCTHSNTLKAAQTITVPFAAYEGTTMIPCAGPTPANAQFLGVTPTVVASTSSTEGSVTWSLPSGKSITNPSGVISLTFTATASTGNVSIVQSYSWSRNTAAADGQNAVLLQIYTPNGSNIVSQTVSSVTLAAQLTDGSTDVTSNATAWQWAKFQSGSYNDIAGATSSSYTVTGASVDSYASFRLTATYGGNSYIAYYSVFDKTDPIQVAIISTIGTQLVNGVGAGAIYVKVTRNGSEIDTMKSERFLTANPSTATSGDKYYKIDSANRTVTLMKYNGSTWSAASSSEQSYSGSYSWSWRDKDGNVITSVNSNTLPATGKVLYFDGDFVDTKIIGDVEVTI